PPALRTDDYPCPVVTHPLLTIDAGQGEQGIVAETVTSVWAEHPSWSAAELLDNVDVFDAISITDSGAATSSGVALVERVFDEDVRPAVAEEPSQHLADPIVAFLSDLDGDPAAELEVAVAVDRESWDDSVSVPYQQALAMVEGRVFTECDLEQVRTDTLAARLEAGEAALAPLVAQIEALGGRVSTWSAHAGTITLSAGRVALGDILALPELTTADLPPRTADDAGISMTVTGEALDGMESSDLLQVEPLYLQGYEGRIQEHVAVFEPDASNTRNSHASFYDRLWTDPSATLRVVACLGSGSTCTYSGIANGTAHPTDVTSTLASDLTEGQDPLYPGTSGTQNQRQRSGVARKTSVVTITDYPTTERDRAISVVLNPTDSLDVRVVTHSASDNAEDSTCTGATANSRAWNAMYEGGMGVFQSNGNTPPAAVGSPASTANDCSVHSPGSAIGLFVSSAYSVNAQGAEYLYALNGQGGTSLEGAGRTIIGMLTPTKRTLLAEESSSASPQYDPLTFCCSSGSTPALTGSAVVFRQFYRTEKSTAIDDPGVLYVNLLLMGDRRDAAAGRLSSGFHNLTGAGILRLRTWDDEGLDGPAGWASGQICVHQSESVYLPVNAQTALPAAVDYLKAVSWWYDHDHDDGNPHDKIDLSLQQKVGTQWLTVVGGVSATDDNRQRVYVTGVAGSTYRLRLYGRSVVGSGEGCGTNGNKVYHALVFEDNARDDDAPLTT
ncbi:MAG: hypothetical protein ABMB14_37435, partial [Myxococcota bacterium]